MEGYYSMAEEQKRINIELDEHLHKRLKLACVATGMDLGVYVTMAVRESVRSNKKLLESVSNVS